jgi:serine/threonine protein kinase
MHDRYETLEKVGSGAMGVVYRARDRKLDRIVAVKQPHAGADFYDTRARRQFEQEATILARLHHPAIVHVYDICEGPDQPFLVMNFVEGGTLEDALDRKGPLPPDEVASLGVRLAGAVSHAHEEDVLHRDLKPTNILLQDGKLADAVVADFGIAHLLERTTTARREGTPAYMSPEQLEGKQLDERSDVYGLGAVLYRCLSEKRPYGRGDMFQIAAQMTKGNRIPLAEAAPEAPSWLVHVVEQCVKVDPNDRYDTAEEVGAALRREERPPVAVPPETPPPEPVEIDPTWPEALQSALRDPHEVTHLDVSGRGLATLPSAIGRMRALRTLNLWDNELTEVPEPIGALGALEQLYLTDNQMTALPASVGRLARLEVLILWGNNLEVLPESIGFLTALEVLDLDSNELEALPEAVGQLEALRELHVRSNGLKEVPSSVGHLPALEELDLYGNELTSLPQTLGTRSSLQWVDLRRNPLSDDIVDDLRRELPEAEIHV